MIEDFTEVWFVNLQSCPCGLKIEDSTDIFFCKIVDPAHLRLDVPLLRLKSGCHKFEVEYEFWQATVGWGSKNHAPSEVGLHSCYQWDMPNY